MTQNTAPRETDDTTPKPPADPTGDGLAADGARPDAALDADAPPSAVPGQEEAGEMDAAAEETPQERIAALEAEVARLNREYLSALAEAQNAKRMADKRIQDNTKYAVSNLARALLPVADNMERALAAAPEEARVADPNLKNLAIGVEMTAKELGGALAQYGVKRMEAMDRPFDPNLHQAMQEMDQPDVPAGTVVQVYQTGYTIHDRLLRPAMVVVSRGGPKRGPAPAPAPAAAPDDDAAGAGAADGAGGGLDTSA